VKLSHINTTFDINRERWVTAMDVGINPTTGEIDCKMNYVAGYLGITYSSLAKPIFGALQVAINLKGLDQLAFQEIVVHITH
jgi:hypothetical protein